MFLRGWIVRHKKTGGEYVIVSDRTDNLFIEATGQQAYAYTLIGEGPRPVWIRPAAEMESGRFELATSNATGEARPK